MSDRLRRLACAVFLALSAPGCGTTKSNVATEQLLMSNAVDQSVASIDFRALAGQKVFLDTEYIVRGKAFVPGQPTSNYVNSEYFISALRQQMAAAGCLLQEKKEDADYIVEARLGTLGSDAHEVTYGIPANNLLSAAANFVPTAPNLPAIPEIAFAKRNQQLAAAKVGVFAYDRQSREIVWQSGIADARSTAKATWLLGAGPFQQGEIYTSPQFAGVTLALGDDEEQVATTDYFREMHFVRLKDEPPPEDSPSAESVADAPPSDGESTANAAPQPDAVPAPAAPVQQTAGETPPAPTEPELLDSSDVGKAVLPGSP